MKILTTKLKISVHMLSEGVNSRRGEKTGIYNLNLKQKIGKNENVRLGDANVSSLSYPVGGLCNQNAWIRLQDVLCFSGDNNYGWCLCWSNHFNCRVSRLLIRRGSGWSIRLAFSVLTPLF